MPRKTKTRKRTTRRSRKSRREEPFGFDFDFFDNDVPKIEVPTLDFGFGEPQRKIDPNKLPKAKLINILAEELSVDEIYRALIRLGKHKLAEEFINEVELIEKKYERILLKINGEKESCIGDKLLDLITDEIIFHMKKLYTLSFKPKNEIDFHKQIESFLNGIASVMETSLSKFGLNVEVYREYKLPSNERIDLAIHIGNIKIGIEVKYDLETTSKLQRLLGQIDRYISYFDVFIIMSYHQLSNKVINVIKSKEDEKGIPIRIITPNKII